MTPTDALHDEIQKLKATNAAQKAKIERFKVHWEDMEKALHEARDKVDEYARQRNDVVTKYEAQKETIKSLEASVAECQTDIEDLCKELTDERLTRKRFEAKVAVMNSFVESLKENIDGWLKE